MGLGLKVLRSLSTSECHVLPSLHGSQIQCVMSWLAGRAPLLPRFTRECRQNDNIRLLTYINLLFLPLAFCTSIFSMQTILPSTIHASWFAITICAITAFTAFLVFNLQLMSEVVEAMIGKGTKGLRERMHEHQRPHWIKTGQALQMSREATAIVVQNRLRCTSHWTYFLFIIETAAVTIPIHELKAASTGWGHLEKDSSEKQDLKPNLHGNLLVPLRRTLEDERGISKDRMTAIPCSVSSAHFSFLYGCCWSASSSLCSWSTCNYLVALDAEPQSGSSKMDFQNHLASPVYGRWAC